MAGQERAGMDYAEREVSTQDKVPCIHGALYLFSVPQLRYDTTNTQYRKAEATEDWGRRGKGRPPCSEEHTRRWSIVDRKNSGWVQRVCS